ncbi:phosphoglycolate phosphatase [Halovenus rubra]|uniref:Phosphoglycolate phosphatase n=2 Tax=Halovenus rubra TaxID=869890 RepID=A0ABD5XAK4_9EURY|nr:phosphoglycolate phosphatase [Halovenus rubra]
MSYEQSLQLADSLPSSLPPLTVDIDGTLTDDTRAVDPRVFPVLQAWPAPVVIATGKAMPYPVALCEFLGLEVRVIAENGGVVISGRDEEISYPADPNAAQAVATAYRKRGYDIGWGAANLVNRWRETELAVSLDSPLDPLEELAAEHGLTVVDTGYAYHVHATDVDKGVGLRQMATNLGHDPGTFAFIGDSPNDIPGFDVAGRSVTVANSPAVVKQSAEYVTDASYGSGFLEAVKWLCKQYE